MKKIMESLIGFNALLLMKQTMAELDQVCQQYLKALKSANNKK